MGVTVRVNVLKADLARSNKTLERNTNKLLRQAASAMVRTAVNRTPVDTGRAVSNWRVGLGQPTRSDIGAYSPGQKGSTASANQAAALAAAESRIATATVDKPVYISNNVKYYQYIRKLAGVEDAMLSAGRAVMLANRKVI